MGYRLKRDLIRANSSLDNVDVEGYTKVFKEFDRDGDGHISSRDLRKLLEKLGEVVNENQLRDLISEVDIDNNSMIELNEFLQVSINSLRNRGCKLRINNKILFYL